MKLNHIHILFVLGASIFAGCKQKTAQTSYGPVSADDIKSHIAVLANDSLLGRKPFGPGEPKAIGYIVSEFKKLGLAPGNNGSYFQNVPMVQVTGTPSATMEISGVKLHITLKTTEDFVIFSRHEDADIELKNAPMVFAGYGIVAPEYHWNDYAGLDVKGKVVVVLVNDPGFKSGDKALFKGDTMTYYGRWTYKYEEAARQGAAGILIVHQTEPASYGWSVIKTSNTGPKLYLQQADKYKSRALAEGWITDSAAHAIFKLAGINGDVRALARRRDFKPINLMMNLTVGLHNQLKFSMSHNVVALLKGTERPDQTIIYSAHWDHLGTGAPVKGDSIYNGAVDNASGSAALLAIAKAFTQSATKPKRSIVFLSVTAEEQGLLGSEYYASHPIYPLATTVANLNMDALGFYGPTKDLDITGKGQNDLDDYVAAEAATFGLELKGDARPGAGSYYRSDHFNFAKVGVPALDLNNGTNSIAHGNEWGKAQKKAYNDNNYHQPSDNYSADMDCSGMAEVANILYHIGDKLAGETTFPGWKSGSEFKALRK